MKELKIYFDGIMWIAKLGDNDETAIIGTGESVFEAIVDFEKRFANPLNRRN